MTEGVEKSNNLKLFTPWHSDSEFCILFQIRKRKGPTRPQIVLRVRLVVLITFQHRLTIGDFLSMRVPGTQPNITWDVLLTALPEIQKTASKPFKTPWYSILCVYIRWSDININISLYTSFAQVEHTAIGRSQARSAPRMLPPSKSTQSTSNSSRRALQRKDPKVVLRVVATRIHCDWEMQQSLQGDGSYTIIYIIHYNNTS